MSDIIESVENPVAQYLFESVCLNIIRYIRLSDDYSTNPQQWKIGRVAIVAYALGLAPFKVLIYPIGSAKL